MNEYQIGRDIEALFQAVKKIEARMGLDSRGSSANRDDTPTKSGWWIKIRKDKTECDSITFYAGDRPENARYWRTWSQGQPAEFDLAPEFKDKARLYVRGVVSPEGKNGWFCMMFQSRGVKHFDFDNQEDHEKDQTDTDDECK